MKIQMFGKNSEASILFSLLALAAAGFLVPHAFAQVSYTSADDPHGPLQSMGWAAGMTVAGAMAGVGVFTAIRRSIRH